MWTTLLRRTFLGQLLLAPLAAKLLAQQGAGESAPGIAPELWARVPEDMRYIRVPLVRDHDGWPLWKQAMAALKPEPELLSEGTALDADSPNPIGDTAEAANRWLDENRESLRLFRLGLERGRLQVPLLPPGDVIGDELMEPIQLRTFSRLLTLRAKRFARQGDFDAALREWFDLQIAARLLAEGEGYLITWLVANAVAQQVHSGIQYLARNSRLTVKQLKAMQAAFESRGILEAVGTVTRVELCAYSLPQISLLPEDRSLGELLEAVRKCCEVEAVGEARKAAQSQASRQRALLLDGHPRPFDKGETTALLIAVHQAYLAEFERPWKAPAVEVLSAEVQAARQAWPPQLRFNDFGVEPGGELTLIQFAAARQKLRDMKNPVGRVMVGDMSMLTMRNVRCNFEVSRRAAQLVVALRIYEQLHHRAPDQLQELVDRGILKQLLLDPFANKPFGYLRDKQVIWSVGANGDNQPQDEATLNTELGRRQWSFAELPVEKSSRD